MRSAVLLCVVVLVSVASAGTVSEDWKEFQSFIREYERVYASPEEMMNRFDHFRMNLRKIAKLNLRTNGNFGVTQFSDWSEEEWNKFVPTEPDVDMSQFIQVPRVNTPPPSNDFTWVGTSRVTYVKNQYSCGSCWAFSAAGCAEGRFQSASLSPQQLVDCDTSNLGCSGGNKFTALSYAKNGWQSWDTYGYLGYQSTCKYTSTKKVYSVTNVYVLPNDPATIVSKLVSVGPLAASLDASPLQSYKSYSNPIESSACSSTSTNHAVVIVGYKTISGKTYYVVKNSWGSGWGKSGYFEINASACLMSTKVGYNT